MSFDDVVIDVRNLSKCYEIYDTPRDRLKQLVLPRLHQIANRIGNSLGIDQNSPLLRYYREFWALNDISFQVRQGETVGIIGRNGSGKSTLLQILAGTLAATSGETRVKGRVAALLELGSGFDPEFTGCENVFLNGRILGLSQKEIESRYDQIVDFADIGEFIDQPVKTYSSGMFVRLAFAVQAHLDASIVIIDEALAVGDVFFRQKCYERLEQLRNNGTSILLVSHSMTDIEQFCSRALLLDHGSMSFYGPATEASKRYYLLEQFQLINKNKNENNENVTEDILKNEEISFWPNSEYFLNADDLIQVENGMARCLRFAVCDNFGNKCNSFYQGETAVFYYEFKLSNPIAVPLVGIVLQNDRGINVHGKGTLEYGCAVPGTLPSDTIIRCRQSVELKLELGEYTFELGLATIPAETYNNMSKLNYEQIYSKVIRLCHLPKAGVISINWRIEHVGSPLTHHGIADLPGAIDYGFQSFASTGCH